MRNKIFLALILSLLMLNISLVTALIEVESKVLEKIENNESVKVIVKLKDGSIQSSTLKKEDFLKYELNDLIDKVYLDYPIKAGLYDSTRIINAQETWALQVNSLNLTGLGQTICIIDTGVNYNHPDLGGCLGKNCKVLNGYDFVNDDSDPMDDNGHGTHIAGISAANGIVKGIAPEAGIIAIKVLDSNGEGYSSDVIKGIELCLNYSEEYNISSIVLSLSTSCLLSPSSCSSSFCEFSSFEESVYKANNKGVNILAAAGNEGLENLLPAPACVRGVMPIAASDKQDNLWTHSNRNSILKIIAPGENIYSTYLSSYESLSGTSMAVPHIAGAIAIINQFLLITNQTKNHSEIESTIYNTGLKIVGPDSNISLSRLDLFNYILFIDNQPPKITLEYPKLDRQTSKHDLNFSCMADDWQLSSLSLSIIKLESDEKIDVYNNSINISNDKNTFNFSISNLSLGNYLWVCEAKDKKENLGKKEGYFFVKNLSSNLLYPNKNQTISNEAKFSCLSESSINLTKVILFIWNNKLNEIYNYSLNISGLDNITDFNYNFTDEGTYHWNCLAENYIEKEFASENYSIIYNKSVLQYNDENIEKNDADKNSGTSSSSSMGRILAPKINNAVSKKKDVSIASSSTEASEKTPMFDTKQNKLNQEKSFPTITGAVIGAINNGKVQLMLFFIAFLIIVNISLSIYLRKIKNSNSDSNT